MNRVLKIAAYPAATSALLLGLVCVGLTWAPLVTNYDIVFDRYSQLFSLATGLLVLGGGLASRTTVTRFTLIPISILYILIGLGAHGDGEPMWKVATLVWLLFLAISAGEYIRFAKR